MQRSVRPLSLSSMLYVKHVIKYLAVIYSQNDTENNNLQNAQYSSSIKTELLKNYRFLR
jgi:hypothetical protein